MTDCETSLMQQVADPSLFDAADRLGRSSATLQSLLRQSRPSRSAAVVSAAFPCISVKHIGHTSQESADQAAVRELVTLLLQCPSMRQVEVYLDALVMRGFPAEQVYLRFLQPAARHLGEMWLEDVCSFVDVTLATAALQSGMRYLAPRFHQHGRPARPRRSVILSTLGGDQHTFGLAMTAEFFRRSGWAVSSLISDDGDELACRLRDERNAIVGFSVSRTDQLPELSRAIRRLRRPGGHRVAGVLVGGPLCVTRPDLARESGADAVGLDARQALAEAEALATAGDGE